jgi:D-beta-D-heptose 7-phosphate kinase/D-beta-D-heptose 1-phosphate adenosyltransferase
VSRLPSARDAILSRAEAGRRIASARRRRERIVFTSGCFDLLHVGHVRCLEEARSFGDRLVVGLNNDASVRRIKGPERPVVPARQRAELLAALACVDWVVLFGGPTPRALIGALQPDVYAKGGDWSFEVLRAKDAPAGWDGEIRRLRQIPGIRTTAVVDQIRKREGAGGRHARRGGRA